MGRGPKLQDCAVGRDWMWSLDGGSKWHCKEEGWRRRWGVAVEGCGELGQGGGLGIGCAENGEGCGIGVEW